MSADPIWKAFAESGDPLYYLLYKAVCMDTAADKKQSGTKRENKDTGQQTQTLGCLVYIDVQNGERPRAEGSEV